MVTSFPVASGDSVVDHDWPITGTRRPVAAWPALEHTILADLDSPEQR